MKLIRVFFGVAFLLLESVAGVAFGATVTVDNFNATSDGGYGIRDTAGVLVQGSGFSGAIGRFTISNSAISTAFSSGNLASIQAGFAQFGSNFALDDFGPGLFQSSEDQDTNLVANGGTIYGSAFRGASVYTVLFKGASIATATEMFIAQLNSVFPSDSFAPSLGNAALRPDTILALVVGTSGGPVHDYGFGGGALPTFGLAAIPEPSRAILLGLGFLGFGLRRRRFGLV